MLPFFFSHRVQFLLSLVSILFTEIIYSVLSVVTHKFLTWKLHNEKLKFITLSSIKTIKKHWKNLTLLPLSKSTCYCYLVVIFHYDYCLSPRISHCHAALVTIVLYFIWLILVWNSLTVILFRTQSIWRLKAGKMILLKTKVCVC